MVRKLFAILIITTLLITLFAPNVMAEPQPDPAHIPHEVLPGDAAWAAAFGFNTFADLWVELEGTGAELPGTTQAWDLPLNPWPPYFDRDDFLRGIEWTNKTTGLKETAGVPIGFPFKFMQGPPVLGPGWPPAWLVEYCRSFDPPLPIPMPWEIPGLAWPVSLEDAGYDRAYVAINGFLVFDDPGRAEYDPLTGSWVGMGQWNWWPWQLPTKEPPNNFVAPYWTDLAIGDNTYEAVTQVCALCTMVDPVSGICLRHYYFPCAWELVERPRGRLLYATVGDAPNRKFVVEWLNARNVWTGNLATFEVQLFEGSNAILFLYKDFQTKDASGTYLEIPSVVVGMEDYYGSPVGFAGNTYTLPGPYLFGFNLRGIAMLFSAFKPDWPLIWTSWAKGGVPQPMAAGSMRGFVY